MVHNLLNIMLFGPGIRFVPEVVWRSKFFWIALLVMIVGILIYHNRSSFSSMKKDNLFSKFFSLLGFNTHTGPPKILYSSDGRSGHVWYRSAETEFAMYYEFCGGNCIVGIDVPSVETWKQTTGLPLERREEVLNFIGQQVVKDQITGGLGYFKIEGNWLNIYQNDGK
jgi:hypothetical protein